MPDNYKCELQICVVGNRIIDEPIQGNDIKENNILLVRHFDDKFPITEEQLQTMKCFNCQKNIKCNEKLGFNLDKLKQWHKHIYKNPYASSIQHILTSDFSTLLSDFWFCSFSNINISKTLEFDIIILNLFFYFCFKFTLTS